MNNNLKIIGHSIGIGSLTMWLMIFINAHLINNYSVILYLNNLNEAYLETFVLTVGIFILSYDLLMSVIESCRSKKDMLKLIHELYDRDTKLLLILEKKGAISWAEKLEVEGFTKIKPNKDGSVRIQGRVKR